YVAPEVNLRFERRLVGRRDAGKIRDLTANRPGIQAFGIAADQLLETAVNEHFDERGVMRATHLLPCFAVRRDGGNDRNDAVARQEPCDESEASDILVAIMLREAEVA